ncbi:MAG: YggS family pyridoxal phosphate-dependent enzyme [Myxococcota bacterium]
MSDPPATDPNAAPTTETIAEATAVAERVRAVQARIAAAAEAAHRPADSIQLVAVSKRQPVSRIVAAVAAGVRVLGENYVQEARAKRPEVEAALTALGLPSPAWHMIGPIQRRKARLVVQGFEAVESLDRVEVAIEVDRRAQAQRCRIPVLLQVNTSGEAQKAGVPEGDTRALFAACRDLPGLKIEGLMTLPAATPDAEASRPAFRRLRELRDRLKNEPGGEGLTQLSMGMSGDFEVAIQEGATRVRVGTALFGPRQEDA